MDTTHQQTTNLSTRSQRDLGLEPRYSDCCPAKTVPERHLNHRLAAKGRFLRRVPSVLRYNYEIINDLRGKPRPTKASRSMLLMMMMMMMMMMTIMMSKNRNPVGGGDIG